MSDLYYKVDFDFDNFPFWSGARDRMEDATEKQKRQVEQRVLDYCFSDENIPTETEINDLVWFECDDIFFPEEDEEEDEEEVEVEESSKPKDVTLSRKEGRKEKESLQEIEEALKILDGSVSEKEVEESSKPKDVTLSRKEGRKSKEQQLDENASDDMLISIDKGTYKDWLSKRTTEFYPCNGYSDDFWNEIIDYIVDNEMIDPYHADPMYVIDNIAVNGEIHAKDECAEIYPEINNEYNGDVDAWIDDNSYSVFDEYVVLNFGY